MKPTYYLLLLPLITACTVSPWPSCGIDNRVTVQVPVMLTEQDLSAQIAAGMFRSTTRVWLAQDSFGTYQVMRLTCATDPGNPSTYYEGIMKGQFLKEQGRLVRLEHFRTAGVEGIDYQYSGISFATGKRILKHYRNLLVGRLDYSFNFFPTDKLDSTGTAGNAQRRRFFDSITVKP